MIRERERETERERRKEREEREKEKERERENRERIPKPNSDRRLGDQLYGVGVDHIDVRVQLANVAHLDDEVINYFLLLHRSVYAFEINDNQQRHGHATQPVVYV